MDRNLANLRRGLAPMPKKCASNVIASPPSIAFAFDKSSRKSSRTGLAQGFLHREHDRCRKTR